MNIRLLGKMMIVEEIKIDEKINGIYIPDEAKKKPIIKKAKVLIVGEDLDSRMIKAGDIIHFHSGNLKVFEYNGEQHGMVHYADVIAIEQ